MPCGSSACCPCHWAVLWGTRPAPDAALRHPSECTAGAAHAAAPQNCSCCCCRRCCCPPASFAVNWQPVGGGGGGAAADDPPGLAERAPAVGYPRVHRHLAGLGLATVAAVSAAVPDRVA
eukprot:scaffold123983_cov23-Tisochrysis_lutea.AAC.1